MTSREYRRVIADIVHTTIRKHYPGIKVKLKPGMKHGNMVIGFEIAHAIHKKMYNVELEKEQENEICI